MNTVHTGVERRAAQRFGISLPVSIRRVDSEHEDHGVTQDLSARGVYLYSDCPLQVGTEVEITLLMPAEITLSDAMRVRCRGRVLRLDESAASASNTQVPSKMGAAIHFEHYEYLSDAQAASQNTGQYQRVAALHNRSADSETDEWPAVLRNAS